MSDKIISTTIEILGKYYPIRCPESEIKSLQEAASLLNSKMTEVRDTGKVINLERIAIITGLNIANQLLQLEHQKGSLLQRITHRVSQLHDKLDGAMNKSLQTELLYTDDQS